MKHVDLLTIGDTSIDLYMKVDTHFVSAKNKNDHPQICFFHGSKIPVDSFETSIAGNACNVAVSCKNFGLKTSIYTELGDDANAQRIISELDTLGIDSSFCIKNPNTPTNVHAIVVYRAERTIFSYHEKRDYKLYSWPKPKWLFYTSLAKGFEKFQKELVAFLKKNPQIGVVFNPGSQQLREGATHLENILEVTHVLFVNKEEAQLLTKSKENDLLKLHQLIQKKGPKLSVITNGKKGSSAYDGKTLESIGIYKNPKPIVDKTGAGDAYASGFVSALFYNKPLKTAMKWGAINASSVMTEIGAIKGLRNLKSIQKIDL